MTQPVVHFEITGRDPARLREYFGALFGWEYDTASPVAPEVSDAGEYGFVEGAGIPGGVGGGPGHDGHLTFYVGVDDVAEALAAAERLGGTRVLGPVTRPDGGVVVGQFRDPEGHLVGVAGPK